MGVCLSFLRKQKNNEINWKRMRKKPEPCPCLCSSWKPAWINKRCCDGLVSAKVTVRRGREFSAGTWRVGLGQHFRSVAGGGIHQPGDRLPLRVIPSHQDGCLQMDPDPCSLHTWYHTGGISSKRKSGSWAKVSLDLIAGGWGDRESERGVGLAWAEYEIHNNLISSLFIYLFHLRLFLVRDTGISSVL